MSKFHLTSVFAAVLHFSCARDLKLTTFFILLNTHAKNFSPGESAPTVVITILRVTRVNLKTAQIQVPLTTAIIAITIILILIT